MKNMKKSLVIGITVVAILIITSIFYFWPSGSKPVHSIACLDYLEIINNAESQGESSICQQINDKHCKETCFLNVAVWINDETICSKIEDNEMNSDCYKSIARQKKDSSICDLPKEIKVKDDCYQSVALATGNESICNLIYNKDNISRLYYCIGPAPKTETSPEICSKFTNFEECIRGVVHKQTNNAASRDNCEKIVSSNLARDICIINSNDFWSERASCDMPKTDQKSESCENNPPCNRLNTNEGIEFCNAVDSIGPYSAHSTNINK